MLVINRHLPCQLCRLQVLTGGVSKMRAPFVSCAGLRDLLRPTSNSAGGTSCSRTHCLLQDGTWAGQHELVAVARMLPADLCIYQAGQPSWTISSGVTSGKAGGPTLAWPRASSTCTCGLEHALSKVLRRQLSISCYT